MIPVNGQKRTGRKRQRPKQEIPVSVHQWTGRKTQKPESGIPVNGHQWSGRRRRKKKNNRNVWTLILLIIFGLLVLFGIIRLIGSVMEQKSSKETDDQMRLIYYTEEVAETLTPAPTSTPEGRPSPQITVEPSGLHTFAMPDHTEAPTPSSVPRLGKQGYPGNPERSVSTRFQSLRKENKDIIGWLTIGSMVDEAVVQLDNEFYMDHNVKKEPDVSGAIFLDQIVSLESRPYALILYGHNMKNGARFGNLRNFERLDFYRKYPFITFDTLYEEGRYVVFSVGVISTEESDPHYLDFFALNSRRLDERQQAIEVLKAVSVHSSAIDVALDDQILLLVTCVENDSDRRIVAARRIRDGEDQQRLKQMIQ